MLALLRDNALLLLFVVAAIGYVLGRVRVAGVGLGVAAVLFAGLAIGALDRELKLPEIVQQLGLVVFVYTVGVSSGPGFFAAFRRRGLRDNGLALGAIVVGAALAAALGHLAALRPGVLVGAFTGALTNTPALAGVVEALRRAGADESRLADPVVGYSVAYPMGVLGLLAAMVVAKRLRPSEDAPPESVAAPTTLVTLTARVTREEATRAPAQAWLRDERVRVLLGRVKRAGAVRVVSDELVLELGDLVSVVGGDRHVRAAIALLGELSDERLELDRTVLDFRRVFVSNPKVAGLTLLELALPARFGAIVTRVRRGDVELLPDRDTVIELGDRVRVVAPRERMEEISKFLGDSYSAVSEIDVVTFGLGIALGLLVGAVPIPTFVGPTFKLGIAGGPLVVGLLLGKQERTGPLVWSQPFSASLTLRQLGLVLFLAGVGTRSGYAFVETLKGGGGLAIFAVGAGVTFTVALAVAFVGRRVLGIGEGALAGMMAGIHTQPAALAFATEQHKDGTPAVGYATVFPLATIAKIVVAQVLIATLSR